MIKRPRFGFMEVSVDPQTAFQDGVLAEKIGVDTLWVPDHFIDVDGDRLEPWTVLSAVSARTRKIRLASSVTDAQRSHPARTAHSVASLDWLSKGRAILGIGAGEAMNIVPYGLPWETPPDRVQRLAEAIQIIRLLWSSSREKTADFQGKFFKLTHAFLSQPPKQKPSPPIYVGALSSKETMQIVGQFGDGWLGWFNTPDTFQKRWSIIKEAARSTGRNPENLQSSISLMLAFPRNRREHESAMRFAKITMLMEKTILTSLNYTPNLNTRHYQHLLASVEEIAQLDKAARQIPDELVHKCMAIGDKDEAIDKIEALCKAGATELAMADLLAPKTTKRSLKIIGRIIRGYR